MDIDDLSGDFDYVSALEHELDSQHAALVKLMTGEDSASSEASEAIVDMADLLRAYTTWSD